MNPGSVPGFLRCQYMGMFGLSLFLLKLKTETENIVAKYFLNVWIVPWDLFLMKKLLKSEICGFVNNAQVHYSPWKSQHLRLLFINSSRIPLKTRKRNKKIKKRRRRRMCLLRATVAWVSCPKCKRWNVVKRPNQTGTLTSQRRT